MGTVTGEDVGVPLTPAGRTDAVPAMPAEPHRGGALAPYDALVLLSFGGPEGPEDVMPFLRNVTRGRGIPPERLVSVAEHYHHFGGRSPINDQNRALLAALRAELGRRDLDLPLYWGNRNWEPFVTEAFQAAHEAGARRLLAIPTSAYSSYSGCRQYREDIAEGVIALAAGGGTVMVDKVRHYFNDSGFVAANADAVATAVLALPDGVRVGARVAFVTHSVPVDMDRTAGPEGHRYTAQHRSTCAAVAREAGLALSRDLEWDLVYCSRSGPPSQPWLEPDINDHLRQLSAAGVPGVVAAPIGFISDHMEVKFDMDTEAQATAREIGLPFVRAATVGTDPRFVAGLLDLCLERAAQARGESVAPVTVGGMPASWAVCPAGCCPNPRLAKPAAAGEDWAAPAPL